MGIAFVTQVEVKGTHIITTELLKKISFIKNSAIESMIGNKGLPFACLLQETCHEYLLELHHGGHSSNK